MDADRPRSVGPPSRIDLTLEAPRAWVELGGFIAAAPALRALPRGEGRPVLVLPGFLASDSSTVALRRLLRRIGHRAYGWRLGRNLGPTGAVIEGLERSVEDLSSRHGQPIDLVGWSLGGVYGRELGRRHPERVRQVLSMGSPFNMEDRRASHSSDDYERFARFHDTASSFVAEFVPSPEPLPIPSTAIYTRNDGIVAWQTCVQRIDGRSENVEVRGSHCGLGHNASVALVVADRLARSAGHWTPFRPPRRLRMMYPDAVDGPPGTTSNRPTPGGARWTA